MKKRYLSTDESVPYLHGYSPGEQERLLTQGKYLEPFLYSSIDYSESHHLIEIGCGVGAQTQILHRRFPYLQITSVDYEPSQITKAKEGFEFMEKREKVNFEIADATSLPYENNTFDAAFICWVLEHVSDPIKILKELSRVLKASSKIYLTEVFNSTLYVYPPQTILEEYWRAFNEEQINLGGDPYIGIKIPNLLKQTGFKIINSKPILYQIDSTSTLEERQSGYSYWRNLFLSASESLLGSRRIHKKGIEQMVKSFQSLEENPNSVFFSMAWQHHAIKN